MKELDIYKQAGKMLLFIALSVLLCKLTNGYFTAVLVLIGVGFALAQKLGWALVYFVLMPFFVVLNPAVLPKSAAVAGYALRAGPLLIGICLAIGGMSRKGSHRLPFIAMIPFLMAALISSSSGWAPKISYLKWINFVMFLFGIWYGTQNLQHRPKDVFMLRSFFLALCAFLILGSIAVLPFPSIAYATSLSNALREGGVEFAEEVFQVMQGEGMRTLFCGITNHSQGLAPMLASALAWMACDMLFIERRFRIPHVALIALTLPLLYLTRSRVALLSGIFALGFIYMYTSHVIRLPRLIHQKLGNGMLVCIGLIVLVAVIGQIRGGIMSEWARKSDDASSDKRSLVEAMTSSRMGLIDMSLRDFKRNPLLGMGFQVAEYTKSQTRGSGFVVSASVEKDVLPVMMLGEGGLLGAACFLAFLASFYWTCSKRKYYITITAFSVLLVTNLGEATFFSPGGVGGILWMMSCVGGFTLDTVLLHRKSLEQQWGAMARMQQVRDQRREFQEGIDLYGATDFRP